MYPECPDNSRATRVGPCNHRIDVEKIEMLPAVTRLTPTVTELALVIIELILKIIEFLLAVAGLISRKSSWSLRQTG